MSAYDQREIDAMRARLKTLRQQASDMEVEANNIWHRLMEIDDKISERDWQNFQNSRSAS